jgi:hypothetical protein
MGGTRGSRRGLVCRQWPLIRGATISGLSRCIPVGGFSLTNLDDARIVLTLTIAGGTGRVAATITLGVGERWSSDSVITLTGGADSLTVQLAGAVNSTEPEWQVSWVDHFA